MRHQKQKGKLSRDAAHRKALLMNLSREVIDHERIQTTQAKAKATSGPQAAGLAGVPVLTPGVMVRQPASVQICTWAVGAYQDGSSEGAT